MKKFLKFLSLLIPLVVAAVSIAAVQVMVMAIYYSSYFWAGLFLRLIMRNENITLYTLLENLPMPSLATVSNIAFLSPVIWVVIYFLWYWRITSRETVVRGKLFTIKNILLLLFISVGYQLAITGLMDVFLPYFEDLAEEYSELMEQLESASPLITFISVVILAPISEELIFRGVIFKKALSFTSFTVANIIQALFFGLFHMNIVQGVYAFAGGLAMGYVAYQFRTIKASILFHLFFNSISYVMIAPFNMFMKILYIAVGMLITGFALLQIKKIGGENSMLAMDIDRNAEYL